MSGSRLAVALTLLVTLGGLGAGAYGLITGLSAASDAGAFGAHAGAFGSGSGGPQYSATFVLDGQTISETQSAGQVTVSYSGEPRLDYSGPGGCKGRYFTTSDGTDISVDFHYSSRDAYLVWGQDLYHFAEGPEVDHGRLTWRGTFGADRLVAIVDCPPPPPSGPLLPSS